MSILPGTTRGPTYAQVFGKGKAIRLLGGTSGYVDLVSPAAPTPYSLTLPTALPGVTGYVLACTDAGVLSWVAQTPASSPAGTGTNLQIRKADGTGFDAVAGSSWDGTTLSTPFLTTTAAYATPSTAARFRTNSADAGVNDVNSGIRLYFGRKDNWNSYADFGAIVFRVVNNAHGAGTTQFAFQMQDSGSLVDHVRIERSSLRILYDGSSTYQATLAVSSSGGLTIAPITASGTNIVGGNLILAPGPSTGNATPSSVIIQSSVVTTSGSAAQTLADTLMVTNGTLVFKGGDGLYALATLSQFLNTRTFALKDWYGNGCQTTSGHDFDILSQNSVIIRFYATLCQLLSSYKFEGGAGQSLTIQGGFSNPQNTTAASVYLLGGWNEQAIASPYTAGNAYVCGGLGTQGGLSGNSFICYDGTNAIGKCGIATPLPSRMVSINDAAGECLRLVYNNLTVTPTYYTDFAVSAAGNLTITPSGGIVYLTGNLEPATDNTYYLGRNDDDTPKAWKGVVLKDTTNGKYYRLEIISGVVTATDLTD
jgi:hypothetical protein